MIVREPDKYILSQDYSKLWEIAQKTSVACFVYYDETCDIAQTLFVKRSDNEILLSVSSRGISYVEANSKEEFLERCNIVALSFIDPCSTTQLNEAREIIEAMLPYMWNARVFVNNPIGRIDFENFHTRAKVFLGKEEA